MTWNEEDITTGVGSESEGSFTSWVPDTSPLILLDLGLPRFLFLCYWWEITPWNAHRAHLKFQYLYNIGNFIFQTTGSIPSTEGIHQPCCQTCPVVWHETYVTLFYRILLHLASHFDLLGLWILLICLDLRLPTLNSSYLFVIDNFVFCKGVCVASNSMLFLF